MDPFVDVFDQIPYLFRPASGWPVWHDIGPEETNHIVSAVLTAALAEHQPWYLDAGESEDPNDSVLVSGPG